MLNIVVLVSGGGTNLQALLDAEDSGVIKGGRIMRVISSSADAYALERARSHGICTTVVERKAFNTAEEFDAELLKELESCEPDLIVMAGFLCILGERIIQRFQTALSMSTPRLFRLFAARGITDCVYMRRFFHTALR